MALRVTTVRTKAYSASGVFRDYVPAGVVIEGWGDATRWHCTTDSEYMKLYWYVATKDTAEYVPVTPPPPPDPEPNTESIVIAAHTVSVEIGGVMWEYWYPQVTLERVG